MITPKQMRALLVLVVLAASAAGAVYGYRSWLGGSRDPVYRTETVRRGTIVSTVSATGAIEPLVTVLVGSQVSGTVTRWYADFNQRVQAGFVLATLDQERFKAALAQRSADVAVARARVAEAEARLASAALERRRVEDMARRQAASPFELDSVLIAEQAAAAALQAAQAQVEAAEAARQFAAVELEKTVITSPIDGIVISRNVDEGQTVAASLQAPTLFTIANDLSRMRVNAAVSETDIGRIREGMPAEFRVDAYPGRRFQGVVSQVRFAQTVVDNVVTYTTLIDVDNGDLSLRPGMTATILFEVAKATDTLLVPNAALRFDPQPPAPAASSQMGWAPPAPGRPLRPRVFRVVADRLVEVPLELGLSDGSHTQVVSGDLKEGDAVVVGFGPNARIARAAPPRMPRGM